ncbi:MAG: DUF423 domain-containing protein [Gammaproteobacteria bacterium]|nr:DUF423 domain-containing protein [Gammaproteobacteria bacterium]
MNVILLLGAILGLASVIMGAYIDHGLAPHLSDKSLSQVLTAVRYHQSYAIVICAIALSLSARINPKIKWWLTLSAYLFLIGILLFSFSIYLSVILSASQWLSLAPWGGSTLMLGWVCLIRVAFVKCAEKLS